MYVLLNWTEIKISERNEFEFSCERWPKLRPFDLCHSLWLMNVISFASTKTKCTNSANVILLLRNRDRNYQMRTGSDDPMRITNDNFQIPKQIDSSHFGSSLIFRWNLVPNSRNEKIDKLIFGNSDVISGVEMKRLVSRSSHGGHNDVSSLWHDRYSMISCIFFFNSFSVWLTHTRTHCITMSVSCVTL